MRFRPLLLLCCLAVPTAARAQRAAVTVPPAARADSDAAVLAARRTYQAVERGITDGTVVARDTTIACVPDPEAGDATEFTVYRDRAGLIRRLTRREGTDHWGRTTSYYYDSAGALRFAFARMGAVNGTDEEERVYYADGGRVVRRRVRQRSGPGYPLPPTEAVASPAVWLRRFCQESP